MPLPLIPIAYALGAAIVGTGAYVAKKRMEKGAKRYVPPEADSTEPDSSEFFSGLSEGRKNQIKFRTALVTSAVHLHGTPEPREIEAVQESVRENLRLDTGGEEKNFPAELDDIISGGYVPWDHLFEMERAIDRTDHGVEDIENTISILEKLLREVNRDKRQILNPEEELDEYAWYLFKVRLHFRRKQHIPLFITRDIPEGSNVGDVIERIPRNKVLEIYSFTDPQDIQSRDLLTTYPHNPQGLISIPRLIQADELREQWCEMAALLGRWLSRKLAPQSCGF